MVEWYRAGEPYQALMADCAAMLAQAAEAAGTRQFSFRGRIGRSVRRAGTADGGRGVRPQFAGIDLLATLPDGKPDRAVFARAARVAGIRIADDDTWGDIFSRVLVERIEPNLGIGRATILDEYPAEQAALARPSRRSARRRALRALCLRRRTRQRLCRAHRRARAAPPARTRDGGESSASTASAIRSTRIFWPRWRTMPEACGIALGLDRLVMLATGASRIDQVLWNPITY